MAYLRAFNKHSADSNGITAGKAGVISDGFSVQLDSRYGRIEEVNFTDAALNPFGTATSITSITKGIPNIIPKVLNGQLEINGNPVYVGDVIDTSSLQSGEAQRMTISRSSTNSGANNDANRFDTSDDTLANVQALLVGETLQFEEFGGGDTIDAEVTRVALTGGNDFLVFLDTVITGTIQDGTDAGGEIFIVETPAENASGVWELYDGVNTLPIASNK